MEFFFDDHFLFTRTAFQSTNLFFEMLIWNTSLNRDE